MATVSPGTGLRRNYPEVDAADRGRDGELRVETLVPADRASLAALRSLAPPG